MGQVLERLERKEWRLDANDPQRAGQRASRVALFGERSRYLIGAVHTRFDAVVWLVTDAETEDTETGLPCVIRQASSLRAALDGVEALP